VNTTIGMKVRKGKLKKSKFQRIHDKAPLKIMISIYFIQAMYPWIDSKISARKSTYKGCPT